MSWRLYQGSTPAPTEDEVRAWLDDPPPWRQPLAAAESPRPTPGLDVDARRRADRYVVTGGDDELQAVNVALLLRRPLLVRGVPGIGKSSLAYSVAQALGLGAVLRWEVGSRTTLEDGLYDYDAISHLRDAQGGKEQDLGDYITLGPLGTALLPGPLPRVLLIDELDKASYDLPNDLLHVFEEGHFRIRELARQKGPAQVFPADFAGESDRVAITDATVRVAHHPVVIITTNDEREFPDAFRRRCVELELKRPDDETMKRLVGGWLEGKDPARLSALVETNLTEKQDDPPDWVLQYVFAGLKGLDATRALGRRSR